VEWVEFLKMKQEVEFNKEFMEDRAIYWYLAQIAREIRAVLAKTPNKIKKEHFLLKFKKKDSNQPEELSEEERQKRLEASKARWKALAAKANKPKAPVAPVKATPKKTPISRTRAVKRNR
jgi:hypothetical protein